MAATVGPEVGRGVDSLALVADLARLVHGAKGIESAIDWVAATSMELAEGESAGVWLFDGSDRTWRVTGEPSLDPTRMGDPRSRRALASVFDEGLPVRLDDTTGSPARGSIRRALRGASILAV